MYRIEILYKNYWLKIILDVLFGVLIILYIRFKFFWVRYIIFVMEMRRGVIFYF